MLARLRLIRPLNLFLIVLGQTALFYQYLSPTPDKIWQAFLLVFSTLLCAAAGYVINDILDLKTDRINRPERPLPSGKISLTNALVFYFTLLTSSFVVAYFSYIDGWLFIVLFMNIALFLYSLYVKRMAIAGNLLVSACIASVFVFCNLLFDEAEPLASELVLFAFFATFLRESFKSTEDVQGDNLAGFRTMPVLLGVKTSMYVTGILSFLFGVALAWHSISSFSANTPLLWIILIGISIVFYLAVGLLSFKTPNTAQAGRNSLYIKLNMLLVLAGLFLL